jgi:hypothetical protein
MLQLVIYGSGFLTRELRNTNITILLRSCLNFVENKKMGMDELMINQ